MLIVFSLHYMCTFSIVVVVLFHFKCCNKILNHFFFVFHISCPSNALYIEPAYQHITTSFQFYNSFCIHLTTPVRSSQSTNDKHTIDSKVNFNLKNYWKQTSNPSGIFHFSVDLFAWSRHEDLPLQD